MILYKTLQQLIGQISLITFGSLHLGISTSQVLLTSNKSIDPLHQLITKELISWPTIFKISGKGMHSVRDQGLIRVNLEKRLFNFIYDRIHI